MRKFENCDLFSVMGKIVDHHVQYYRADFETDKEIMLKSAQTEDNTPRRFLWLCRTSGTHCFPEKSVYTKGTYAHNTWKYFGENTTDEIIAFEAEIDGLKDGVLTGNLYELDYREHYKKVIDRACPINYVSLTFCDGSIEKRPCKKQSFEYLNSENIKVVEYLSNQEELLQTMEKFNDDRNNTRYYPWNMDKLKLQYGEFNIPTVELYQLKYNNEADKMRFSSYSKIRDFFKEEIKSKNYHLVYVTPHNGEILGDIWERFNINQPEDYHTYSLSVSDVIVINDYGRKKAYFVDSYDFVKIPDFFDSASGAGRKNGMEM